MTNKGAVKMFQFLKGAIKRNITCFYFAVYLQFQFLKGAIKRFAYPYFPFVAK